MLMGHQGARKLEIHIPRPFTAERPPVRFTHRTINSHLDEHPLASRLPSLIMSSSGKASSVFSGPQTFFDLGVPSDAPNTINDFLYSDEPQLSLHVNVLTDVTLVSLQFLHTVTDALGLATLMKAWQSVLAGKSDIPRLLGLREDPMAAFYTAKPIEKYVLIEKELKGVKLVLFVLRFLWEKLTQGKIDTRTICLTPATLAGMRRVATSQLLPEPGPDGSPPFISDGDILAAWISQQSTQPPTATATAGTPPLPSSSPSAATPPPSTRPVTILVPVDVRGRVKEVFPPGTACVQNAVLVTYVPVPAASHGLLGTTALAVRRALAAQTTRAQFDTFARLAHDTLTGGNRVPVMADTRAVLVSVTNWTKAKFFDDIDFSPAVVATAAPATSGVGEEEEGEEGGSGKGQRRGRVAYFFSRHVGESIFTTNIFTIAGKDSKGNYWISGTLPVAKWAAVEESIAKFDAVG